MVYSNLNTSIHYKESPGLNLNDAGHESIPYEIEIFSNWINVMLGKINTIYADKNVVFIPIYLVVNDKMVAQIGVFELAAEKATRLLDSDGNVVLELLDDPLLYKFVTEEFISKISKTTPMEKNDSVKHDEVVEKEEAKVEPQEESDEDKVVKIKIPDRKKSEELEKAESELKEGVFEPDSKVKAPELLEEETAEEADELKKTFRKKKDNAWIANFMKNNNFKIHEVEANGDCFLAVLRDAFKQVGLNTDVKKLRALLASEATEEIFQRRRESYNEIDAVIKTSKSELTITQQELKELTSRLKNSSDQKELSKVKEEIERTKSKMEEQQADIRDAEKLLDESLGDFEKVDTLEKFRAYLQTTRYWVDTWAIGLLERKLKFKIIILSERSFLEKSFDSVIDCGEVDKILQEKGVFHPDYYIMTTFSGNHYKLITYKDKRIFKLSEIPFYVKNLVINKCLEKNAGPFYIIPEFRDLVKTKYSRKEEDVEDLTGKKEDDVLANELYDPSTELSFYSKAPKTPKPGKATNIGEKIKDADVSKYKRLAKHSEWRKKLDDDWITQFTIDGKKWASIEHFYQGSKFKHGFPDFYKQFSLDSESDMSKSSELARDAGGSGKKKGVLLRPKNVVVDSNFHGEKGKLVREEAVRAKFSQNEDLKQLLLATNDAKLNHFIRGDTSVADMVLMKIRKELR